MSADVTRRDSVLEKTSASYDRLPPGLEASSPGSEAGAPSFKSQSALREGTSASWPFFRGDNSARGYAPGVKIGKLQERWRRQVGEGRVENAVTASGALCFVALTHGDVAALRLDTGVIAWRWHSDGGFTAAPSIGVGRVYIGDGKGEFFCLDSETGTVLWKVTTEGPIDSPANIWNDMVLFGSQDGTLYCVDAFSGQIRWRYTTDDQLRSFPSLTDGRVLAAGCDRHLHIVDLHTGEGLSRVNLEGPTGNTAAVARGKAFVGTEEGVFLAIDIASAEVLWTYSESPRSAGIRTSAAVAEDLLVFAGRDRKIRALNPTTGAMRWTFALRQKVDSSPVITEDSVIFGADDGRLYIVERRSGNLRFVYDVGAGIAAPPTVLPSAVIVGTLQGKVVCLGITP